MNHINLPHVRVHQGVRQREGQVRLVERAGALGVGRVDDDMGQADGNVLALFDPAVRPDGDIGADLDGAAFVVEEPEPVPAAGGLYRAGLADQAHSGGGELIGESVHVGAAGRAEGDQVDALVGRLPQPDDVLLGGALGGEEGQAGVAVLGFEAPGAGEEVQLPGVVGHGQVDVAKVGDKAVGHRVLLLRPAG
jgi:hypothetical protein